MRSGPDRAQLDFTHRLPQGTATDCRAPDRRLARLLARRPANEETDDLREVDAGDAITVSLEAIGASADREHWRIRHRLVRGDGTPCAMVVVRGAWFDLATRRVVAPPPPIAEAFAGFPRAADFAPIDRAGA